MWTIIIAITAFVALIIQSIIHRMERKDLYDRMMSRDYSEYQLSKDKKKPKKPNDHGNNILLKRMRESYRRMYGDVKE